MDSIRKKSFRIKRIKQQGSAALETIVILPAVLMILFAIAQYSMIFATVQLFDFAVKESLRNSVKYVDENCYYGGSCANHTETLKDKIKETAKDITGSSLFGKTLPYDSDDFFSVDNDSDGDCCKVTITLNYSSSPFISNCILPDLCLPIPNKLTSTASLKL